MPQTFGLICTVWGERFINFFSDFCSASLLAKENLPALAENYQITLLLYTTEESLEALQRSDNFHKLQNFVTIRPVLFPALEGHWLQWQHAVANFSDEFFGFLLIIPDCIYAKDALTRIGR